jgi:hypothetical protein
MEKECSEGRAAAATALREKLLQAHAIGVVSDGRRPIGEDSEDTDFTCERVQRLVHIAVFLNCLALWIEQIIKARERRTTAKIGSLERPGDDVESEPFDIQRILGRNDLVVGVERKQREDRRR